MIWRMIRILIIFVWIEIIIDWVCVNSLYNNVGEVGLYFMLRMLIMFLGLMKDHWGVLYYLQIQVLGKPVYTTIQIDIIYTSEHLH